MLTDQGKTLLMADTNEGTVSIFAVQETSKHLSLEKKIVRLLQLGIGSAWH